MDQKRVILIINFSYFQINKKSEQIFFFYLQITFSYFPKELKHDRWKILGLTQAKYGLVLMLGSITYGLSNITSGILVDIFNSKKMHLIGLLGSGSIAFGYGLLLRYSHDLNLISLLMYFIYPSINFFLSFGTVASGIN